MPSRLREKARPASIRDFLDEDPQVVAVEGFRALPIGRLVERGELLKLSDEIVRQFPQFFAALIPVNQVLGEIER